jgi:GH35 family endo-1,4-beta-xylanase
MEFHITELNYWLNDENPKSFSVQKRQVISYNNIVNTLISKKNNGVVTLNIWGLFDRNGPGDYPKNILSLYDQQGNPKQSLYTLKKSLMNKSVNLIFEKQ